MGRNDDREKGVCAYRVSQKSVQGKSNPRAGGIESPYRGRADPLEGRIEV